jgi:hypothetical protein
LALGVISYGAFVPIWLLVQASWVRRATGKSRAFVWALVHLCSLPIFFLVVLVLAFMADSPQFGDTPQRLASAAACAVLLGLYAATVFTLRAELQAEPFRLALNGPISFLGGPIYLQARLRELDQRPS